MQHEELIAELNKKQVKADLYNNESLTTSFEFEQGTLKNIEKNEKTGYGLRVINSKTQQGFLSQTQIDHHMIEKALELSHFGDKVNYEFPNLSYKPQDFLYDSSFASKNDKEIITMGENVLEKLKNEDPSFQYSFQYTFSESQTRLLNTSGFNGSYKESASSFSISALKGINDKIITLYESSVSRSLLNTYEKEIEVLKNQIKNTYLPYESVSEGYYQVILSPSAAQSFFSILLTGFRGTAIEQGVSPIISRMGDLIAPRFLTIENDGLHPLLLGSSPFDDEGVFSQTIPLIYKGVCNDGIYDLKTASKLGKVSTSNGLRSNTSAPTVSFRNLIIEQGELSKADLIKNISQGYYIESLVGAGMSNTMSGELAANIGKGFKVQNGELITQMKDSMITGNVFDMLKNLIAVSSDRKQGSFQLIPSLLFDRAHLVA